MGKFVDVDLVITEIESMLRLIDDTSAPISEKLLRQFTLKGLKENILEIPPHIIKIKAGEVFECEGFKYAIQNKRKPDDDDNLGTGQNIFHLHDID